MRILLYMPFKAMNHHLFFLSFKLVMRDLHLSITANGPLTQDFWTIGHGRYGPCSILVISPVVPPDGFVRLIFGPFCRKIATDIPPIL